MINALWNILRIGTQPVNCLICNQQIMVSITFLIVSSLNMDIVTRFRTVWLAEQSLNWSDYVICINVHSNSPVWYMCQVIRISIDIGQWLRHSNLKCQLHTLSLYVIKWPSCPWSYGSWIYTYHHWCYEFEYQSGRGVQHYVINLSATFPQPITLTATIYTEVALNTFKQTICNHD